MQRVSQAWAQGVAIQITMHVIDPRIHGGELFSKDCLFVAIESTWKYIREIVYPISATQVISRCVRVCECEYWALSINVSLHDPVISTFFHQKR